MKRMMVVLAAIAATVSGCSGSVNGTVGGNNLPVADAIFAVLKDAGKTTGAIIVLSDKPKLCDSLKANREPKSSTTMFFSIARVTATEALAPDVGDYTVIDGSGPLNPGNFAFAGFSHTDTNCTNTLSGSASTGKSGLVKVTNFKGDSSGSANGTFDVTFGGGDKVTGSFNATFCDITAIQGNPNCE